MCCLCSVCMLAMVMQASVINSKPECLTLMDEFFPLFLYMLASVNLTYDCSVVGNCDIIWWEFLWCGMKEGISMFIYK